MRTRALLVLAVGGLAACGRIPAPVPAAGDYQVLAEAVDTSSCTLCAVPASVRVCEVASGVRTRLHWHLAGQGVSVVDFFVVDKAGQEQPFARQPAEGEMDSGPWLRPGLTFRVRDSEDGRLLAEVVIDGVDC